MDQHHRKSYTSCESQIANTKKFLCITVINLAVRKERKRIKFQKESLRITTTIRHRVIKL